MSDICDDNRFALIEKYKKKLIEATNIETSTEEMKVLDNILFRFWQMGWLEKLEQLSAQPDHNADIDKKVEGDLISRAIDAHHLKRWILSRAFKTQLSVADVVDQIDREYTIEPERKTGQWIPCSERLPEEHIGFYLVTVQKRRITALNVVGCDNTVHDVDIARWDYDRRAPQRGYHWCKADKVIAWMPLPEPYKEGAQE